MTTPTTVLDLLREANRVPDPLIVHDDEAAESLYTAITRRTTHGTSPAPPSGAVRPLRGPWYRRPAAVFVTAMVATVILLVPVMLFRWWGSSDPAAPTTPTTTTVPTTTTTEAIPTESTASWEPLGSEQGYPSTGSGRFPGSVGSLGDGYLVVDGNGVWVSLDGRTWVRTYPADPPLPLSAYGFDVSDPAAAVWDAAGGVVLTSTGGGPWRESVIDDASISTAEALSHGRGFLALGVGSDGSAVIYWSSDGVDWELVGSRALSERKGCTPDLVLQADTYVLVLADCSARVFPNDSSDFAPEMWRSEDGRTWTGPTDLPEGVLRPTASRGDTMVFTGSRIQGDTIWVTDDGVDWEKYPIRWPLPSSWDTIAVGDGFIGAGFVEGREILVATSTDGRSWDEVSVIDVGAETVHAQYCAMTSTPEGSSCPYEIPGSFDVGWQSLYSAGDRFFLISYLYGLGTYNDGAPFPMVWTSQDGGSTWEMVDIDRSVMAAGPFAAVIGDGEQYVFLGTAAFADRDQLVVSGAWVWTPPDG